MNNTIKILIATHMLIYLSISLLSNPFYPKNKFLKEIYFLEQEYLKLIEDLDTNNDGSMVNSLQEGIRAMINEKRQKYFFASLPVIGLKSYLITIIVALSLVYLNKLEILQLKTKSRWVPLIIIFTFILIFKIAIEYMLNLL